ncbi:MAG: lysophospholipid acyltransferase family protein [bacterium]
MRLVFREYNFVYWLAKTVVRTVFILFSRTQIVNERNVPSEGGLLLVCNHISHLDPPMVATTCRRMVYFLAKKELFMGFIVGWFMRNSGQVPVHRGKGKDAVDAAVDLLNKGRCICIFPEGTRSRTGEMMRPHTGIVVIASQVNVPIVPILVEGTFKMMPPKAKFPKLFSKMRITYGEPFYLTEEEKDLNSKEKMRETADMIMSRIRTLKGN